MNDMSGHGNGMAAAPATMNSTGMMHRHKMMMHMTFFWGKNTEVLFDGWPGKNNTGMYVVALIFVFVMSALVEWLSHSRIIKPGASNVAAGLIQTFMHAIRVGVAYMAMLAVMSFNGGIFLASIAGHSFGFLVFGSRVFRKTEIPYSVKTSDLPPMACSC
ncbi:hypothetical protein Pint_32685 [Pistacia integerrima]|uniref:Uncharacterized protein n=1 Tax=Pistacia integerrima TaxID=434235 RepID=A0ACC0XSN8_9ROSI|nr:hypothetical protein Pint_32685 [Pistacia integerrima]